MLSEFFFNIYSEELYAKGFEKYIRLPIINGTIINNLLTNKYMIDTKSGNIVARLFVGNNVLERSEHTTYLRCSINDQWDHKMKNQEQFSLTLYSL